MALERPDTIIKGYICMCIYVCVCVYVCMYVCVYVCMYVPECPILHLFCRNASSIAEFKISRLTVIP